MYGIIGFLALSVVVQQHWALGAAYAAAMLAAAIMTSKRWSRPGVAALADRAGAGAAFKVMSGGKGHIRADPRRAKWLN